MATFVTVGILSSTSHAGIGRPPLIFIVSARQRDGEKNFENPDNKTVAEALCKHIEELGNAKIFMAKQKLTRPRPGYIEQHNAAKAAGNIRFQRLSSYMNIGGY